jgi:hypothetical protein
VSASKPLPGHPSTGIAAPSQAVQEQASAPSLDAQIAKMREELDRVQGNTAASSSSMQAWWSTESAMTVSSLVLGFGVLSMLLATYLLRVGKNEDAVLRVMGTIIVLFAAIFLVVAGYSDKQIAPVMGLLGTIAGYLLGKGGKHDEKKE